MNKRFQNARRGQGILENARRMAAAVSLLLLTPICILAGGARTVDGVGNPMVWDTGFQVIYHPDQGSLGTLANPVARDLLATAFRVWENVGLITFAEGSVLPYDISADGLPLNNPGHWRHFWRKDGDGLSPVIFDSDGSIIDDLFGVGARFEILGIAALDTPVSAGTTITEASVIINGAFFDGVGLPDSPTDALSETAFLATMVHEIGHFVNLDHSVLNHELANDDDPENDVFLPTMYPMMVDDEEAIVSLNPDDVAALTTLYSGVAPSTGVAGSVVVGGLPFQGAHVVLRKTDDPLLTAYSVISGGLFFPCNPGSHCDPCNTSCDPSNPPQQGDFSVEFIEPGDYTVCVEQIDTYFSLVNKNFIGPLATPAVIPGPEECYDVGESAVAAADDPDEKTIVPVDGLGPAGPIDILINDLPLSDPFEPNDALAAASALDDLAGGQDTAPGVLGAGDLDVYAIPVVAGQTVRIDVEASEIGSSLDAVIGFYDATDTLIAVVDDAVDPDTGHFSFDPALEIQVQFSGTAKVVVSSYPDLDLNGSGGLTTGPYWIRVELDSDADGDGIVDRFDVCPDDSDDDIDRDGICGEVDNCPDVPNQDQTDTDGDNAGDVCDIDSPLTISAPWAVGGTNQAGARFGREVNSAGDVNGDGFDDVIVSANYSQPVGVVFVYHGSASGLATTPDWMVEGIQGRFGESVDSAGDVNGDGYDDVIVGAISYDNPENNEGRALVYHGSASGLSTTPDWAVESDQAGAVMGAFVSGAGDVNGDGYDDVIVSAYQFDQDPNDPMDEGRAYVYPGSASGLATIPVWTADGDQNFPCFGCSVASAGDINGDGYDDIIVGAHTYENDQPQEGRAYVYLGSPSGPSVTPDWVDEGNQDIANFGISVDSAGDVNGDGFGDVIVGAYRMDNGQGNEGLAFVYLGSATGLALTPAWTGEIDQELANFGYSVATAGDLNGDGFGDVIIGAELYHDGETNEGGAFVYLGSASGLGSSPAWTAEGNQDNACFGCSVATAGDVNGDGLSDVIVGAWLYDGVGVDEGRAFVYLGVSDFDQDADGSADTVDNCPGVPNPTQDDGDGDGVGTVCDCDDSDPTNVDLLPGTPEVCDGRDNDCDGQIDEGFGDLDGDSRGDACDNCPNEPNGGQADSDQDGTGDACDPCPIDANDRCLGGSCAAPPGGMLGWWPGDVDGSNIHGPPETDGILVEEAAAGDPNGLVGGAFRFDGNLDHVEVAIKGFDTYSYSLWVKADNAGPSGQFLVSQDLDHANGPGAKNCHSIGYDLSRRRVIFKGPRDVGTPGVGSILTHDIDLGSAFTHIVATNDPARNEAALYVNGELVATGAANDCYDPFTNAMRFGRGTLFADLTFQGLIDEIKIFDRPISHAEVLAEYNAGSAGLCKTLCFFGTECSAAEECVKWGGVCTLPPPVCRNNVREAGEVCDLSQLPADESCERVLGEGYAGSLSCSVDCRGVVTTSCSSSSCEPPPDGLVGWWPMDGSDPVITLDLVEGTRSLLNGPSGQMTGMVGKALRFDGNDHVEVPLEGLDTYTYSLWARADNTGLGGQFLISQDLDHANGPGAKNCHSLSYHLPEKTIVFKGPRDVSTPGVGPEHRYSVDLGTAFTHIAATNDLAANRSVLYVNGVEVAAGKAHDCDDPFTDVMRFGRGTLLSQLNFEGVLDEIKVYDRALSPGEILAEYNAGSAGLCKNPCLTDADCADGQGCTGKICSLPLSCPVSPIDECGALPGDAADIELLADRIASLQFTDDPNQPSYGAIRMHHTPGYRTSLGDDYFHVIPYFSSWAVRGLLQAPVQGKLDIAQRWIDWYLDHMDPNGSPSGIVLDHWYLGDGGGETTCPPRVDGIDPNTVSPRLCDFDDASDSPAALILAVAWDYIEAGGDPGNLVARKAEFEAIANVMLALQQGDGLTLAKDTARVEFLLDNSEVYWGFKAAARLEAVVFNDPSMAAYYEERAGEVRQGIFEVLYDPVSRLYNWAFQPEQVSEADPNIIFPSKLFVSDLDVWYADTVAQAWPLLLRVTGADSSISQAAMAALNDAADGAPQLDWTTDRLSASQFTWPSIGHAALLAGDCARARAHYKTVKNLKLSDFAWPFGVDDAGFLLATLSQFARNGLVSEPTVENDPDNDGICSNGDNCPAVTNSDQTDSDGDGIGDVCDNDEPLTMSVAWTAVVDQPGALFGWSIDTAGDVNGDGFDDVIVGAPIYSNPQSVEGGVFVYHGSATGLSATPDWTAEIDKSGERFGHAVAAAGDVNGDGFDDVIVGAVAYDNPLDREGGVFVYHGSPTGLSATPAWTAESDQLGASMGHAVDGAGDVNGDTYDDVIVSAPFFDDDQIDEGRVFVYLGSASGLAAVPSWFVDGDQASCFGCSLSTAGDVNNDGYDDVIVGALEYDNGQNGEGGAFVYLGSSSGLATTPAWTAEANDDNFKFGSSVDSAGDIDGDGYGDVIVGAKRGSIGGPNHEGLVYIYMGSASGLETVEAVVLQSNQESAELGGAVATAGDVDGDGFSDVIIGAKGFDNGQLDEGRIFVHLGSPYGIGASPAWTAEIDVPGAEFGTSVATAGDVNGDGLSEVMAGAFLHEGCGGGCIGDEEGQVFLYMGLSRRDTDADGFADNVDNCPSITNPAQLDINGDGIGDACTPDTTGPSVTAVFPESGAVDVALSSDIGLAMSEAVNSDTVTGESITLDTRGVKVSGRVQVSPEGLFVSIDPDTRLEPDTEYLVQLGALLTDLAGNPAIPFGSTFRTVADATSGTLPPEDVGEEGGAVGGSVGGDDPGDQFGFSIAVAGDLNADGIADLVIGAPGADAGALVGAGQVTLVFGESGLQSNGTATTLDYLGTEPSQFVGASVARAGDMSGDGIADFAIGSPSSFFNGPDSGAVYLVFGDAGLDELAPAAFSLGDLSGCANSTLCGVLLVGDSGGDLAGTSVSFAGDINHDGNDDLLIGAPGASPDGRTGAGKAYLIYGPLAPGVIQLSTVGTTTPGRVFQGESASDRAGEAVSSWEDGIVDGIDDFLIGAPGATTTDEFGDPIATAGYVYAIHGGIANLGDTAPAGVIELNRVANGLGNEVAGVVFLGTVPGGEVGRSLTGEVDINADGVAEIIIGANGKVWVIQGTGPKTTTKTTPLEKPEPSPSPRTVSDPDALTEFGGVVYTEGFDGELGGLVVAAVGDVNNDGVEDFIVGAGDADPSGKTDAGMAFIIYGSPILRDGAILLSVVGDTVPGLTVEGSEPGDQLGRAVGGNFDVNGDGVDDAVVGAPYGNVLSTTPQDAGESYVISPVTACGSVRLEATSCGIGACFATGVLQCIIGVVTDTCAPGAPSEEICDGVDNDCDGITDDATLEVQADSHTVGAGSHPNSSKSPLVDLSVKVYDKSINSCARTQCGGISWQHYPCIMATCQFVVEASTDAGGQVVFELPPGDYLVIGDDGTDKHLGVSASDLACGQFMRKHLQQIVTSQGKVIPGRSSIRTGSELLVIEPEYVEWTSGQELYPFVFESLGDWAVSTSVSPPEGFVADHESLSEEVNTGVEAVQFTITDVGSDWVPTEAKHVIEHHGRREIILARIGVQLDETVARQKGLGRFGHAPDEHKRHAEIIGWIEPSASDTSWTIKFRVIHSTDLALMITQSSIPGKTRGRGKMVRTLIRERLKPGDYEVAWDGLDVRGGSLAPGHYDLVLINGRWSDSVEIIQPEQE